MLYEPPNPTLRLWDTWLWQADDGVHLFHLQRHPQEIGCSSIGHAFTKDWLHWETLPVVLEQGTGSSWDAGALMTGMTFQHDGRYYMLYGAMIDRIQRIGLAVSDDLLHWEKLQDDPILEPGGDWYQTDPREAINYETAWRDPYIFYHEPDACFYIFLCARVKGVQDDIGGGCIAVAQSTDLLNWAYLPPAYVSSTMTCLEVPEYFSMGGRHYMSYTSSYHFGTPYPLADAYQASGTFYLVSDHMLDGYHEPDTSNILHAGMPHQPTNYVGRSIPDAKDTTRRLFYYQHVFPAPLGESIYGSLSAPKYAEADTEGRLKITFADDIMTALTEPVITVSQPLSKDNPLAMLDEGTPDGIFEAIVQTPYAGICFRTGIQREDTIEGLAVWLAHSSPNLDEMRVILGTVHFTNDFAGYRPAFGNPVALRILETWHGNKADHTYHIRVVCRAACVDVYIDDILYLSHTYDPQTMPALEGVGVFYAGLPKEASVSFAAIHAFKD